MGSVARPIVTPYFTTASPAAIGRNAILCPLVTGSTTHMDAAFSSHRISSVPGETFASSVATLSSACSRRPRGLADVGADLLVLGLITQLTIGGVSDADNRGHQTASPKFDCKLGKHGVGDRVFSALAWR